MNQMYKEGTNLTKLNLTLLKTALDKVVKSVIYEDLMIKGLGAISRDGNQPIFSA